MKKGKLSTDKKLLIETIVKDQNLSSKILAFPSIVKAHEQGNISVLDYSKSINIYFMAIRYLILLGLMFSLPLIYAILTPITMNIFVFLLKYNYNSVVTFKNLIILNYNYYLQIIPACIAGAAYLLLLILNFTVTMPIKKRILSLLFSLLALFIINILRLLFFSFLYTSGSPFFDFTHKLVWYVLSTFFVIGIWFLTTRIFSIKKIPVYSDIQVLIKNIKNKSS